MIQIFAKHRGLRGAPEVHGGLGRGGGAPKKPYFALKALVRAYLGSLPLPPPQPPQEVVVPFGFLSNLGQPSSLDPPLPLATARGIVFVGHGGFWERARC